MSKTLKHIVRESISRVLNEGAADTDLQELWDRCARALGAEGMLDELWNCLSDDEIRENLRYIDDMHDLGLFDDEDY